MALPHLRCSAVSGGAWRPPLLPDGIPLPGGCHPAGLQGSVCQAEGKAVVMHWGGGHMPACRQWLEASGLWQAAGRLSGMHKTATAGAAVSSGGRLTSSNNGIAGAWRPHHVCLLLQLGVNGCNPPCSAAQHMTGGGHRLRAQDAAGWPCSSAGASQQKCMASRHRCLLFTQQADAFRSPSRPMPSIHPAGNPSVHPAGRCLHSPCAHCAAT